MIMVVSVVSETPKQRPIQRKIPLPRNHTRNPTAGTRAVTDPGHVSDHVTGLAREVKNAANIPALLMGGQRVQTTGEGILMSAIEKTTVTQSRVKFCAFNFLRCETIPFYGQEGKSSI